VGIVNVEKISIGDGLEKLVFRADKDYILDGASLSSPSFAFAELEVSTTDVRQSGVMIATHAWRFERDYLSWTGWLILREGEFVVGNVDFSDLNDLISMRLHLNPIGIRFEAHL